ncbi:MAG: hypothetical protein WAQ98_00320 [Blastocatellia bacterium]
MLSRIRRFSQIFQTAILSCVISTLFAGICYGQQQGNTIVLISGGNTNPNSSTSFSGGINPAVSGNGQFISYTATFPDLQPAISSDITAGDRLVISRANLDDSVREGLATSLSGDGSRAVFQSSINLIDPTAGSSGSNIYLNVRGNNVVSLISSSFNSSLNPANGSSFSPVISGDGSSVVYISNATDITSDTFIPPPSSVYLFNNSGNTLISRDSTGPLANCSSPSISQTGSVVVFISGNSVFVRDTNANTDTASPIPNLPLNNNAPPQFLTISSDGSTIAYVSGTAIFVIPLGQANMTRMPITVATSNSRPIALNANGTLLAVATNQRLTANDTNNFSDVYLFNLQQGLQSATLVSLPNLDTNNLVSDGDSFAPVINGNGAVIAFSSRATTLTTDNLFSSTNVFASVLAGGLIGGGVGTINLGPVCFPAGQGIAPDAIELSWGFPGVHNEQLRGFKVEINRKEGSQFKQIAKVPADGKAIYIDTSLKANTRYEYRLWIEDPKGFAYSVDFAAKTQKKNKKNK